MYENRQRSKKWLIPLLLGLLYIFSLIGVGLWFLINHFGDGGTGSDNPIIAYATAEPNQATPTEVNTADDSIASDTNSQGETLLEASPTPDNNTSAEINTATATP